MIVLMAYLLALRREMLELKRDVIELQAVPRKQVTWRDPLIRQGEMESEVELE